MNPVLLLWDVDGTLLRTGGAGMRAMHRAGARLFGGHCTWEGVDPAGSLDPIIYADFAAVNNLAHAHRRHQEFHDRYIGELQQELERSRRQLAVMPGVLEVLSALRQRVATRGDVVLGLLTGNYSRATPLKLQAVGIDPAWFTINALGDEAPTRADLVALAMRKYAAVYGAGPAPPRVVVIGDTPRDVACAHAHGCVALAVATGPHDEAALRLAGADVVVRDFADASPLWRLLEGMALGMET